MQNFLSLVDAGFYTGLIFHRVIRGFMIQGGGFTPDFTQKRAKSHPAAVSLSPTAIWATRSGTRAVSFPWRATSDLRFGVLAVLHHAGGRTAPDAQYAAFGKVMEGMEIVDKIGWCLVKPDGTADT